MLAGVDEVEKMLAEQAPIRRTRVSELHAFILWQKGVALLWSADDMVAGRPA